MKTYYLVEPLEHGNGGCHGDRVIAEGTLEYLLSTKPYADFSELRINDHPFGFHPRICLSKDMNDVMYIWSEWEYKWIIE
jgi:hypothetical protein